MLMAVLSQKLKWMRLEYVENSDGKARSIVDQSEVSISMRLQLGAAILPVLPQIFFQVSKLIRR